MSNPRKASTDINLGVVNGVDGSAALISFWEESDMPAAVGKLCGHFKLQIGFVIEMILIPIQLAIPLSNKDGFAMADGGLDWPFQLFLCTAQNHLLWIL
jgi:hypothetical protein